MILPAWSICQSRLSLASPATQTDPASDSHRTEALPLGARRRRLRVRDHHLLADRNRRRCDADLLDVGTASSPNTDPLVGCEAAREQGQPVRTHAGYGSVRRHDPLEKLLAVPGDVHAALVPSEVVHLADVLDPNRIRGDARVDAPDPVLGREPDTSGLRRTWVGIGGVA